MLGKYVIYSTTENISYNFKPLLYVYSKNPYESSPVLKSRTIATVAAAWGPPLIRLLSSC